MTKKTAEGPTVWAVAAWSHLYPEVRTTPLESRGGASDGFIRIPPPVRCVMVMCGLTSEINWEIDVYLNVGEEIEIDALKLNRTADLLDAFVAKPSPRRFECSLGGQTHSISHEQLAADLAQLSQFLREAARQGHNVVIAL